MAKLWMNCSEDHKTIVRRHYDQIADTRLKQEEEKLCRRSGVSARNRPQGDTYRRDGAALPPQSI